MTQGTKRTKITLSMPASAVQKLRDDPEGFKRQMAASGFHVEEISTQPTIDEISNAWTDAIDAENLGGARAETLAELIRLRLARTTWMGKWENDLRTALTEYLEHRTGCTLATNFQPTPAHDAQTRCG